MPKVRDVKRKRLVTEVEPELFEQWSEAVPDQLRSKVIRALLPVVMEGVSRDGYTFLGKLLDGRVKVSLVER